MVGGVREVSLEPLKPTTPWRKEGRWRETGQRSGGRSLRSGDRSPPGRAYPPDFIEGASRNRALRSSPELRSEGVLRSPSTLPGMISFGNLRPPSRSFPTPRVLRAGACRFSGKRSTLPCTSATAPRNWFTRYCVPKA
jgi:hypothetical protein